MPKIPLPLLPLQELYQYPTEFATRWRVRKLRESTFERYPSLCLKSTRRPEISCSPPRPEHFFWQILRFLVPTSRRTRANRPRCYPPDKSGAARSNAHDTCTVVSCGRGELDSQQAKCGRWFSAPALCENPTCATQKAGGIQRSSYGPGRRRHLTLGLRSVRSSVSGRGRLGLVVRCVALRIEIRLSVLRFWAGASDLGLLAIHRWRAK